MMSLLRSTLRGYKKVSVTIKSVYSVLYLFFVIICQLFQSYYTLHKQKDACMHTPQFSKVHSRPLNENMTKKIT